MKKQVFVLVVLLAGFCMVAGAQKSKKNVKAVKAATGFTLKNGDVLVYEVNANGEVYNFEVAMKEIREALVFDWTMPQKDMAGEVTLEKSARATATVYKNFFQDSVDWVLTDSSTVWLSRKNFNELKKGSTIMTIDDKGAERFDRKGAGTLDIIFKGRPMKLKYFNITNGKSFFDQRTMMIFDNAAHPLIIQMNLGWTIVLKEVKVL